MIVELEWFDGTRGKLWKWVEVGWRCWLELLDEAVVSE